MNAACNTNTTCQVKQISGQQKKQHSIFNNMHEVVEAVVRNVAWWWWGCQANYLCNGIFFDWFVVVQSWTHIEEAINVTHTYGCKHASNMWEISFNQFFYQIFYR